MFSRSEEDLSSLDDETKIKLLSVAVQSKNSMAVKFLFAANVDENGHTLGEAIAGQYFDLCIYLICNGSKTDNIRQDAWDQIHGVLEKGRTTEVV